MYIKYLYIFWTGVKFVYVDVDANKEINNAAFMQQSTSLCYVFCIILRWCLFKPVLDVSYNNSSYVIFVKLFKYN